jgi:hypothetical protein
MSASEKDASHKIHQARPDHLKGIFSPPVLSPPATISLIWIGNTTCPVILPKSVELLVKREVKCSAVIPATRKQDGLKSILLTPIRPKSRETIDTLRINNQETLNNIILNFTFEYSEDSNKELSNFVKQNGFEEPHVWLLTRNYTHSVKIPSVALQAGVHYHLVLEHVVVNVKGSELPQHEVQAKLVQYIPSFEDKNKLAERFLAVFEPLLSIEIQNSSDKLASETATPANAIDLGEYCRSFIDNIDALAFEKMHFASELPQFIYYAGSGAHAFLTQLITGILTRKHPNAPSDYINANALAASDAVYQAIASDKIPVFGMRP